MTEPEAQKLVTTLTAAMPGQWSRMFAGQHDAEKRAKAEADTMALYRRMLADLDYPTANAAIERVLATAVYFPTVAEIRAAAVELASGSSSAAGEQWGKVRRAIAERGAYRTPGVDFVFLDELTSRCVEALGWRELCLTENAVADRARFIELYDQLAAAARTEAQTAALPAARRLRELQARRSEAIGAGDAVRAVLKLASGGGS